MLNQFIHYNYQAHRRLWECILTLSDEQFVQPLDYSIGSVRNHMVHLINVDTRWMGRIREDDPLPDYVPYEAYTSPRQTFERWLTVEQDVISTVATIDIEKIVEIRFSSGLYADKLFTVTVEQVLLHVVNHGTDHRAQVLPILHRLGAPTFEQDYMYHLFSIAES
jgi:uncharacterized damage-inducible protein DinB